MVLTGGGSCHEASRPQLHLHDTFGGEDMDAKGTWAPGEPHHHTAPSEITCQVECGVTGMSPVGKRDWIQVNPLADWVSQQKPKTFHLPEVQNSMENPSLS